MSFTFDTLSRIGQTAGKASDGSNVDCTMYMYATADAKNTVDAANYFNTASSFLNVGDVILVKASDGVGWVQIDSNSGGAVDTADVDAITATDSR